MTSSALHKKDAHAVGARRITTRPSLQHVRVEWTAGPLAESTRAVESDETRLPT